MTGSSIHVEKGARTVTRRTLNGNSRVTVPGNGWWSRRLLIVTHAAAASLATGTWARADTPPTDFSCSIQNLDLGGQPGSFTTTGTASCSTPSHPESFSASLSYNGTAYCTGSDPNWTGDLTVTPDPSTGISAIDTQPDVQ